MSSVSPEIEQSWLQQLSDEFQKKYFQELKKKLQEEKQQYSIYPPGNKIFAAFNQTPFDKVKAVIIGQDPYHGPGQANGLSFSVSEGVKQPPSLKNIFKELENDLGIPFPTHGELRGWAEEGVLMLNAFLSVRQGEPGSHRLLGWETFTNAVIKKISDKKESVVFILWGSYARSKKNLIDTEKHFILESPHPSPFSAHKGFLGSSPFSKTNAILTKLGKQPIDWRI